jgi:nucleotide-binding universal stress UspA family protein
MGKIFKKRTTGLKNYRAPGQAIFLLHFLRQYDPNAWHNFLGVYFRSFPVIQPLTSSHTTVNILRMRSMLILTDFSEAAFRAAEYVCALAGALQTDRIVLCHAYQTIVATTDLPVSPVRADPRIYLESMEALGLLHDRLKPMVGQAVKIDLLAIDAILPEMINRQCREQDIDMVVMGVSGKSGLEESGKSGLEKLLIGSSAARILETSEFPVLIVPGEALVGREIKSIVFTTDLKDLSAIPVDRLSSFLDAFKADVYVVNVETPAEEEKYSPETKEVIAGLHRLLEKYHPSFYYLEGDDTVESILVFAGDHKASLIITIPKKHSLLSAIFHKSISKKLAYNSSIPLLSLPAIRGREKKG